MSENLQLPLAEGVSVEASYNDGTTFSYTPTSAAINGNTITPYISDDAWSGNYYYTWYAATAEKGNGAGNGVDIDGSICPKGWKLPYNYTSSAAVSWSALANAYNATLAIMEDTPISISSPAGVTYGGNGSIRWGGLYGFYWSSTNYWGTQAYSMCYYYAGVISQYTYPDISSGNGFTTRCVASPLVR